MRSCLSRLTPLKPSAGLLGRRCYSVREHPSQLVQAMQAAGVQRAFVRFDPRTQSVQASHPCAEPVKQFFEQDRVDYDQHEAVFLQISPRTNTLMGAFIWKSKRGQAAGGIRLREYDSIGSYMRDGLRLAQGMGRKSALAGLWWGGGKGLIAKHAASVQGETRKALLEDYGAFLTSLRGCYIGAEDSGISVADVDVVNSKTRFTTCISPSLGGSGNPSVPTAMGVKIAMDAALNYLNMGTLQGKTVAVQGLGNVGRPLVGFLLEAGVGRVIAADVSEAAVELAKKEFAGKPVEIRLEPAGTPFEKSVGSEQADIFSPCAFGGVLSDATVPLIKAKIVCGAANNQLLDPRTDSGMKARGITYVPDYVCNRMGIVNCANEQYGRVGPLGSTVDPAINRHLGDAWENALFNITRRVLHIARTENITTNEAADKLADHYCAQEHPIWGHRTQAIIDALCEGGWAEGK